MKKRIWELDAARGICILGMIAVHFLYDLTQLYRLVNWELPAAFTLLQNWGGVLFLLISGICVTLSRGGCRRGILVFTCGLLCSAVTVGLYCFGMADKGMIIYFGVLHCLGSCMLLWPAVKKWPVWLIAGAGIVLAAVGLFLFDDLRVTTWLLVPFGIIPRGFATADYFPLLPNFGFFLLGAALGRLLYPKGEGLLPEKLGTAPVARFLQWVGRHSLLLYLLHQPVLAGIFELILLL